jgi:hypothetical protein
MSRNRLLLPEDLRALLVRRFASRHRHWLAGEGQWPWRVAIGSPTENEVARDPAAFRAWIAAWSEWTGPGELRWEERQWPRLGRQRLPASLDLRSAAEIAAVAGQAPRWALAAERYERMVDRWPSLASEASVLARHFDVLADYGDSDFERLVALLDWLDRHPESNLYLRQLPVPGLDTKWVENRKGLVTELVRAALGRCGDGNLYAVCGLRRPAHRLRMRLLCPQLRSRVGGVHDIELPVDEVARLPIAPSLAIVVENLETGLALPQLAGAVAFMRLGNAVGALRAVAWLREAAAIYWGDVDTHGFVILDRAREVLPQMRSILMDAATLVRHRTLWSEEPVQSAIEPSRLEPHERSAYDGLRSHAWGAHNVRLEQERIPWDEAMQSLSRAVD